MSAPAIPAHFALRKLHSLLGLVPIGAFLAFHMWENSLATKGADYYTEHVVEKIAGMRFISIMEVLFIAVPILFHGIYGVIIWIQSRSNVTKYGYFRNWMYLMQRITAVIAFVFILTHVWQTRAQVLLGKLTGDQLFEKMMTLFDSPWIQGWYFIGITAAVFHFCNGLWLMGITWGLTIGPRSQKFSTAVCALIGLLVFALSMQALFGFHPAEVVEAVEGS